MQQDTQQNRVGASFRDPSGFIFRHEGVLYRQVNAAYQPDYDMLMASGLYERLVEAGLLIPHAEASLELARTGEAYKVLRPSVVEAISYPYEWCFSQLKAAALATLKIQKLALKHGMTLKDASAYNIQFVDGKPVLIDTLSFARYNEGEPWVAYRQFCQHFLAPLALMAYTDVRISQLLRVFIDGIPLDMASKLLPRRTYLRPALSLHIHLHARGQQRFRGESASQRVSTSRMSRNALIGVLDSLESGIKKLNWHASGTDWADYYQGDSYSASGLEHKQKVIAEWVEQVKPGTVWDLGANTGLFSRLASARGIPTVAWDVDPGAVEINYRQVVEKGEANLLPLILDLTNPSPSLGWHLRERMSLLERGPVDMIFALALIHHIAISNNVPLDMVARFFAELCTWLIIEFVPKEDPKVQTLLLSREDIFPDYTQTGFEAAFSQYFTIEQSQQVVDSERRLYLMKVKGA
ncbi:MAG TPA: hypothetical protein PK607_07130 [Aggregatilineales bacterium]|nr:hypothetical protein [Aggregatilineales bacterium]